MSRRLQQLVFGVASLVLFAAAAELLARALLPSHYYVWPPGFSRTSEPEPGTVLGISGASRLTINAEGMRGDPMGSTPRYRILAVGGSTTICGYLDDSEAWPYLVQQRANNAIGRDAVWVGNVGRPGHTTALHVLQVETLLRQYPRIDAVVLLVGINDLLLHLALRRERPSAASPTRTDLLRRAFSIVPPDPGPWYRRSEAVHVLKSAAAQLRARTSNQPLMDGTGRLVSGARTHRRNAGVFLEAMPADLSMALKGFAANLVRIIDAAEQARVRVILLTQPALWRYGLTQTERDQLWMGGPALNRLRDGAEYYSVEALAAGMHRFNLTLLRVCEEQRVECVHVAKDVPRDPSMFWDDAHFTEAGARRVAARVSDYLLSVPPLAFPVHDDQP